MPHNSLRNYMRSSSVALSSSLEFYAPFAFDLIVSLDAFASVISRERMEKCVNLIMLTSSSVNFMVFSTYVLPKRA